jgi:sigma-B regulation protein RsbU (phosphoserine phosphatase)
VEELRCPLEHLGQTVECHALESTEPVEPASYGLVVLDGTQDGQRALQFCRNLRTRVGDGFVPTLFVSGEGAPGARLTSLEAGAHACLQRPFAVEEFTAQVQALLAIKQRNDRVAERAAEVQQVNKRLQQAHQRVTEELELARRIQLSFLPQTLPEVPRTRFAVCYRPCGRVGGDFYDVFRLDEHHVGFYVADAMGHGVPASLLTIFLKKGVRAKDIIGNQYRLVSPDEVLQRLNRDLIEHGLTDHPFITMVYGLFDCQEGTLHFSRAGHPHPILVVNDREPELLKVEGTLLGVFETRFPVRTCRLGPGDKVLFYTDGTETVSFEGHTAGPPSLLACAARHQDLPIDAFVERLAQDLFHQENPPDDFTLLGLGRS